MDKKGQEEDKRNIPRIRSEHLDGIYFYKNLQTGYSYIEENSYLPVKIMEQQDFLESIYQNDWIDSEDRGKVINLYERIKQGMTEPIHMQELSAEIRVKEHSPGKELVRIRLYLDLDEQGLIRAYVGKAKILSRKELEDREILMSFSNDKNPAIFINRIARFMEKNPERQYAFIQFDIRKFRYINETYGSDKGDEILRYISDTLEVMCDDDHIYCRLSADLFEIVTYYNGSDEEILEFIDILDARLHRCGDIRFQMSYGISIAPGTSKAYRKHGDEAGLARVYIKNSVLKKAAFFNALQKQDNNQVARVEEIEEQALENGEFHIYLQPKYTYDKNRGKIVGAEALVRWIDSENHIKSPAEFIPIFEKNGFILKLDQFMWEGCCRLLRKWMDDGRTPVPISVNVSRIYLGKTDVVGYIQNLIKKYCIPIELLQIEITETAENQETIQYANDFKAAGFTLMMDDFGSGLSSLRMLKDTPFDVLKMDRLFLDECLENEHGKMIVSHVISMSGDLGLDIIAEGVETREQADFLYDHGCQTAQGFYFSRPVPVAEFEKMWVSQENGNEKKEK